MKTRAIRQDIASDHGFKLVWSEADIDQIRALYTRAMEGWNLGGGEAFAAPFAEEADFVAFDGERFRGREEIARYSRRT